jgi:gentisate 1,2-dioxygenase
MAPLWEVLSNLVTKTPQSGCQPYVWHYDEVRPHLLESGDLITAKEAERRVLILENPGLPGSSQITTSLYAGLQLILPGEVAPAHRHTQSALRFVIEGEGAYTAVDGERTLMHPGDFVITPSWAWHDHGNETDRPMVWLDGLDIPVTKLLDASFAEPLGEDAQSEARPVGTSHAKYGEGLIPVEHSGKGPASPVFNYPYERTREALEALSRAESPDPAHGVRLKYVNPTNGDFAIATMATFMQRLPAGFEGKSYRTSDATVFSVVEGEGTTTAGDTTIHWKPRDVFIVPSWCKARHEARSDSFLFSFSDRAIQEKLGLHREAIYEN